MNDIWDAVGMLGVACFLAAYYLLQSEKFSHTSFLYLGLNLAGALLVMISLSVHWNLPAFLLEAAWALISMLGIFKQINKVRHANRSN